MFIVIKRSTLSSVHKKLDKIMATLEERFNAISGKLDEASGEILAEIENLKKGGTLTPEQEAALEAIEAKANALADIAPPIGG